jgi:hypothetical protein
MQDHDTQRLVGSTVVLLTSAAPLPHPATDQFPAAAAAVRVAIANTAIIGDAGQHAGSWTREAGISISSSIVSAMCSTYHTLRHARAQCHQ